MISRRTFAALITAALPASYALKATRDTTIPSPSRKHPWYVGDGVPQAESHGNDGDIYIDHSTMAAYQKHDGRWLAIGGLVRRG